MGASVAPALLLRAERHVIDFLRAHKATSPDRAVPFPSDMKFIQERRFERLVTAQVIQETPGGGYWLDESMYQGFRSDRRALALVIAAIVTTTAIGMAIVSALT